MASLIRLGLGDVLGDAAGDGGQRAVIAVAVGRRRLADHLGEARAERPERRAAHGQADVGDRQAAAAQQRLGPLDAARHQVRVRRLAVGRAELPGEVPGRHQRRAGDRGHVERSRVLTIHQIAGPPQVGEVSEILGGHLFRVAAPACDHGSDDHEGTVMNALRYVLFYETGDLSLAAANFPAHQAWFTEFMARGVLVSLGPFTDRDGSMAVFTSREAAEEFAAKDPFVTSGVIAKWHIREWRESTPG